MFRYNFLFFLLAATLCRAVVLSLLDVHSFAIKSELKRKAFVVSYPISRFVQSVTVSLCSKPDIWLVGACVRLNNCAAEPKKCVDTCAVPLYVCAQSASVRIAHHST